MNFCDFLSANSIRILNDGTVRSRKKALEILAHMLSETDQALDQQMIFQKLLEREKLSTTALGNGIAIPHCRMPDIQKPCAAVLCLSPGIDYDTPDQAPVAMLFALLVPEDAVDEHLEILANLAKILNQPKIRQTLMKEVDGTQFLATLKSPL